MTDDLKAILEETDAGDQADTTPVEDTVDPANKDLPHEVKDSRVEDDEATN